jgi:predicted dithiol-disulfide oxidoreductase (DUF899 family)
MTLPNLVSRDEWLAARRELLAKEKALTRQSDALAAERRRLPMVKVEKDYRLEGPEGPVGLLELFQGRRQLVVYHFMFDPAWDAGCPGCTAAMDEVALGRLAHLHDRDTSFAVVSRAPFAKLAAYKAARGWTAFDWYSSHDSAFNYDFDVTIDASAPGVLFNYRDAPDGEPFETSGLSCFLREDDEVFHTYSTYQRGTEAVTGAYHLLDLTSLGRQEDWEQPRGRAKGVRPADPSFGGGLV